MHNFHVDYFCTKGPGYDPHKYTTVCVVRGYTGSIYVTKQGPQY